MDEYFKNSTELTVAKLELDSDPHRKILNKLCVEDVPSLLVFSRKDGSARYPSNVRRDAEDIIEFVEKDVLCKKPSPALWTPYENPKVKKVIMPTGCCESSCV